MSDKRFLVPSFLNRIDKKLLLNKPEIWSARTHFVAYFGAIIYTLFTLISFTFFDDARTGSMATYWVAISIVIGILGLVFWLVYLLRFNVFKRYGNITNGGRLLIFFHYFISISIIVLLTYIEPLVESYRANKTYPDSMLIKDVNNINTYINQLEHDSIDHNWKRDTVIVRNKILEGQSRVKSVKEVVDSVAAIVDNEENVRDYSDIRIIDTAALHVKVIDHDSMLTLNDSMKIFLTCPDYDFLNCYRFSEHWKDSIWDKKDIYKNVVVGYAKPNANEVSKKLMQLIRKYHVELDITNGYYETESDESKSHYARVKKRYFLNAVSSSLTNILGRKERFNADNLPALFRIYFYWTLILSTLVFAFRHSTTKVFFLTLLSGILLSIIVSIVIGLSSTSPISFYTIYVLLALCYFVSCLLISKQTKRLVYTGININLSFLTIWTIPMLLVTIWKNIALGNYEKIYKLKIEYGAKVPPFDYAFYDKMLLYAEFAGVILLLLLIPFFYAKLYRKWYALPQD